MAQQSHSAGRLHEAVLSKVSQEDIHAATQQIHLTDAGPGQMETRKKGAMVGPFRLSSHWILIFLFHLHIDDMMLCLIWAHIE